MAFSDKSIQTKCPLDGKASGYCRKFAVKQALSGVSISEHAYTQLNSVLDEVCQFCIQEHAR